MSGHPGVQRYGVVAPFAAVWVLDRLKAAGVGVADVARDAETLRNAGAPAYAEALESMWTQLVSSARDHAARHPRPRPQVVDEESLHGKPRLAVVEDTADSAAGATLAARETPGVAEGGVLG